MAKNIDFMGATFPDVPSIRLPQHEGGLVSFDDTSDATATAGDIAKDKTAYVNGEKLVGTHEDVTVDPISITSNGTYSAPLGHAYSPVSVNVPSIVPTGSQTFTENGTYDVASIAEAVINVAGGGALTKKTIDAKTNSDTEMVFTGLVAEPKAFVISHYQGFTTYSSMTKYIICMDWIGNQTLTMQPSGSNIKYSTSGIVRFGTVRATAEYDNGTLTITITDKTLGQFRPNENYRLAYLY